MQANVEYIGYAKANKLNPGWSKLIIQALRQNRQYELANQLKPSLFFCSLNLASKIILYSYKNYSSYFETLSS